MSDQERYAVVGAGPAGAAAAKALVALRRKVVVLDAGLTLEPARELARQRMAAALPHTDDFLAAHNVNALDDLGRLLAGVDRRRPARR